MTYLADFCAWFQRQQAANRLEMLVTLLQMMHPLELRFVGACVEELARKDYYSLREYELRSNSGQNVAQLTDLGDAGCRSRLIVALSLLYSGNYATSTILYKTLLNLNSFVHQLPKTKDVFDEIILLLVMAKHHPAFRFDQRADVAELLEKVAAFVATEEYAATSTPTAAENETKQEHVENENSCSVSKSTMDRATQAFEDEVGFFCTCRGSGAAPGGDSGSPRIQPTALASNSVNSISQVHGLPLHVTNIAVKGTRKTDDEDVYDLQISWSNEEQTDVPKTLREMYDYHRQLLDIYPKDAGACGSGRKIPYFPGYRDGSSGESASSENVSREIYDYIKDLVRLSPEILRSEYTVNFFKSPSSSTTTTTTPSSADKDVSENASSENICAAKRACVVDLGSSEEGDCMDADGRVKSLTIYNSHVTPNPRKPKKEKIIYLPMANGPTSATSCSSSTAHFSDSNPTSEASIVSTILDPRCMASSTQPKLPPSSNSETTSSTTTTTKNEPSLISAAWVPATSEDDFPSVIRSYSVDSGEQTITPTYVVNFSTTSTSLPPSQSQSPAPSEPQQQHTPSAYPTTTNNVQMSTSASFPVQHNSHQHHRHHHHHDRNSKQAYRSQPPINAYKSHPPNALLQRPRAFAPTYDYNQRPQQAHRVFPFMTTHPVALPSGIPAATFVRAPPPQSSSVSSSNLQQQQQQQQQRIRLVCQQCNGTSTTCPIGCHGNWANGLLTPANAAAPQGPFFFQLTTTPTGQPPPPTAAQLFSPPFLQNTNNHVAQFFGAPPPNFRLPPSSPMAAALFKSASASMVAGEQQHHQNVQAAIDHQMMRRSLHEAPMMAVMGMESCCNCGLAGHTRESCAEPTLEELTSPSHFHLTFVAKDDSASTSQDR